MTRPHKHYYAPSLVLVSLVATLSAVTAFAAPPVLTVPGPQSVNEGQALQFGVSASDPDGESVEFRATGVPVGATFTDNRNNTGTFAWTPARGDAGSYSVIFTADDTFGGTDSKAVAIDVSAVNTAPVLGPLPDRIIDAGTMAIISIWANDDDGDALSFTASGLPPYGTFNDYGTGSAGIVLSPPPSTPSGSFSVTVTVSDGTDSDSRSFLVTINGTWSGAAPVLAAIGDLTVEEGSERSVPLSAEDADGDLLEWSATLPGFAHLVVTGSEPGASTARLDLNPGFCAAGSHAARVAVGDGAFGDEESFTIHVTDVPKHPAWSAPAAGTVVEVAVGGAAELALAGSDPDQECGGPAPVFSLLGSDAGGALSVTLQAGEPGQATLRVQANVPGGEYHVTVRLADGASADRYVDRTFAVVAHDVARAAEARAWTRPKQIHLWLGTWWQRFYLEPAAGTFDPADVDPASVRVRAWGGAGPAGMTAAAVAERSVPGTDEDENHLPELRFDVAKSDLKAMFANLTEPTDGEVTVTATLRDGREVRAAFLARVIPDEKRAIKRCGPNPLNPEAVLEIVTEREGRLRVMVFDLHGRMVRVLAEEANAPAGSRELRFDGRDDRGRQLRGGRYFIRVESTHGTESTPLTILP